MSQQLYNEKIKNFPNTDIGKNIKITLIGCGDIGGTCIASLLYTKIVADIVLIEPIKENFGLEKNLYESLNYCDPSFNITYSNEISASKDSDICLICFEYGKKRKMLDESLLLENVLNFQKFIPEIVKYSPNIILFVLTYPFFILTEICYKIAKIPKHRVFGLGTCLATSNLRIILADRFDVSVDDIICYVIGISLYGFRIPVLSSATICGVNLRSLLISDLDEELLDIRAEFETAEKLQESLSEKTGPARWTIGLLCSKICFAILYDTDEIFAITTNLKGMYNIRHDCCVSMPCIIGKNGIHSILSLKLNHKENNDLATAALKSSQYIKHFIKRCTDKNLRANFCSH